VVDEGEKPIMRKKWLVVAILVMLMIAGTVLTRDIWVKALMIKGLQSAADAKVDIERLHVTLSPLGVDIRKLEIANYKSPMRNLVEVDHIQFGLDPWAIFEKKWIIEAVLITGISIDTPRKTSGYIPLPPPPKEENVYKKDLKRGVADQVALITSKLPKLVLPKPEDLQVVKTFDISKKETEAMQKKWDLVFQGKTIQSDVDAIQQTLTQLSKTSLTVQSVQDIERLKQALASVQKLNDSTQKISQKVQTAQTDFNRDMQKLSSIPTALQKAAKQDVDTLKKPLDMGFLKNLDFKTDVILGPLRARFAPLVAKVQHVMQIKEKLSIPQPHIRGRDKGVFVHFQKQNQLPAFWIKRINITGTGKSGERIEGLITDLTSDQHLIGKNLLVSLSATHLLRSGMSVYVNFMQGPLGPYTQNKITFALNDLPVHRFLPVYQQAFVINQANVSFQSAATIVHSSIDSSTRLSLNPLRVSPLNKGAENLLDLNALLGDVLANISAMQADIFVKGPLKKPSVVFNTNVDKQLEQAFQRAFQKRIDKAVAQVQQQLDTVVKQKEQEINSLIAAQKKQGEEWLAQQNKQLTALQHSIDQQKKALEAQLNAQVGAKQKEAQAAIDSAKKDAERKAQEEIDKAKQKAVDEAKKSLLKGFF
jgi:uncharacterized protein (TIGR03545 family)